MDHPPRDSATDIVEDGELSGEDSESRSPADKGACVIFSADCFVHSESSSTDFAGSCARDTPHLPPFVVNPFT
jgi:hypothetical protein